MKWLCEADRYGVKVDTPRKAIKRWWQSKAMNNVMSGEKEANRSTHKYRALVRAGIAKRTQPWSAS